MMMHELVGVAVAVIALTALSVVVVNGGNSANILGVGANGAVNILKTATLR
jgi:hypothetical protein